MRRVFCFGPPVKPPNHPAAHGCKSYQLRVVLTWNCRTKLSRDLPLRRCSEIILYGVNDLASLLKQSAVSHGLKVCVRGGQNVVLLSRL